MKQYFKLTVKEILSPKVKEWDITLPRKEAEQLWDAMAQKKIEVVVEKHNVSL